jgi:hypothetical protein
MMIIMRCTAEACADLQYTEEGRHLKRRVLMFNAGRIKTTIDNVEYSITS